MTSLTHGRHYLAIPGPSVMPDRVLQAMHRPSPNIYEGELIEITETLPADLKAMARTKHHVAMYIGNGHAAWEAALFNTLSAGDEVIVIMTGLFANGWADMAKAMGVTAHVLDFGRRSSFDPARVAEALAVTPNAKAVLTVHVDTSTSVKNDVSAVRALMDEAGSDALLMADCIASFGCDDFRMDAWGVDVMVAGCQKGLMVPAGMSFVFYSDKADCIREANGCLSRYWDWRPRTNPEFFYLHWCGTAPTHHIYGLREALDMINEEGYENVLARHRVLAEAVWAAFECWSQDGPLELNIADRALRSHAVTTLRTGAPHATTLRNWVSANAGLTLGIGLGMATEDDPQSDGFFRVGHMGHVNAQMILGALGTIQTGLVATGLPHGDGALEAATRVLAGQG
jgi:alanine-glyoxylate transaminase/serine-glyoxylate transaminase/serine-pyruvate transaminase